VPLLSLSSFSHTHGQVQGQICSERLVACVEGWKERQSFSLTCGSVKASI
jgi:hypothetical protein